MKNREDHLNLSRNDIDYLLSPLAIRDRAKVIFDLTVKGNTSFTYHPDKLAPTVDYVLKVIHKNYPDLKIPFHSRWGHFRVGGHDRVKALDSKLSRLDPLERARTKLDLVITSVLLDAGAGHAWSFSEKETGGRYTRSEGLGVASLHMFLSGIMSSDRKSLRADRQGLANLTVGDLEQSFQMSPQNPLVGAQGRVALLNNLAQALANEEVFSGARPGGIVDYLIARFGHSVDAPDILRAVLDGLGPIWPGRLESHGINLGDVWQHSSGLVPFHKLSQWMTYSLIEPIIDAGIEVKGVEKLTGLAEYRNGGLLLDSGLLSLSNPENANHPWRPDSDLIIEWRALTIYLLDQIGALVQKALGKTPQDFPLAKVLEGGTWWAGRFLAQEKRPASGDPPLQIQSDGTVF